jgi:hypothetical protein
MSVRQALRNSLPLVGRGKGWGWRRNVPSLTNLTRGSRFILLAVAILALAAPASAVEVAMKGSDILKTLTGARVDGSNWSQSFEVGGATIYTGADGKQSTGRWDVRGDEYCSEWPPSDVWACYAMAADTAADGTTIIWISADGLRDSARLVAKGQ